MMLHLWYAQGVISIKGKRGFILLALAVAAGFVLIFSFFRLFNPDAVTDELVIPVPGGWQQLSREDTLVRGICLGSGSECGYIRQEYTTGMDKEEAIAAATAVLSSAGWTIEAAKPAADDELRLTARQKDKLLYLATFGGGARVRYEENHR